MEQTLSSFRGEFVKGKRKFKIKNSLGVYDAYRAYRKNRFKNKLSTIKVKDYYKIIDKVNLKLAEIFINEGYLDLPMGMGTLYVAKIPEKYYFKDGKFELYRPVDWNSTLKYWYTNKEAFENKEIIRYDKLIQTKIFYKKKTATYKNRFCIFFEPNTFLKKALRKNVELGKVIIYDKFNLMNK